MKLVYIPIIIFAFSLASLTSCSSKQRDKKTATLPGPKAPFDTKAFLAYNPKDADKKIDAVMQMLHKTRGFNGNVLVAKHGKIIYQKAIGWADYLHRDSLKINSQFELASVTKTITSTAILMLWEQGKLKLDDDVKKFFPDFPYDGVTIRL
ncbi:MAG: serine hydrolase domain-containing protein, partial [Mucilaginibacter sp.]